MSGQREEKIKSDLKGTRSEFVVTRSDLVPPVFDTRGWSVWLYYLMRRSTQVSVLRRMR